MKNGRRIEPDFAGLGEANGASAQQRDFGHLGFGDAPKFVRSRCDQERRIRLGHRIEMKPQGWHAGPEIAAANLPTGPEAVSSGRRAAFP